MISVATKAGINITLMPIFYQKGGFGLSAEVHQRRSERQDVDDNFCYESIRLYENAQMGFGIHILRADHVPIEHIFTEGPIDRPIHLHLAEQLRGRRMH